MSTRAIITRIGKADGWYKQGVVFTNLTGWVINEGLDTFDFHFDYESLGLIKRHEECFDLNDFLEIFSHHSITFLDADWEKINE